MTTKANGDASDGVPQREHHELHLYPGEKRLLFVEDAKLREDVDAWGGPEFGRSKGADEPFGPEPTTAGRFRIGWIGRYHTSSWKMSKIQWGVRLRPSPTDSDDVLFEVSPGRWSSVQRLTGVTRKGLKDLYEELYGTRDVPRFWVFNAFGSVAIRYYPDLNNNRKQDRNEPLSGQMIHASADNEAQSARNLPVTLVPSYGCVHMRPLDRQRLMTEGAFKIGTLLVVHNYGETSGIPRRPAAPP